jgi:hypothetical protein
MKIRVLTIDLATDKPESLRQIDMSEAGQRKWLGGHSTWAWNNNREVRSWAAGTPADAGRLRDLTETYGQIPRDPRKT